MMTTTTTDTITAMRVLARRPTTRGHITVSGAYRVNGDGKENWELGRFEVTFTDETGNLTVALELASARALIDALTEALGYADRGAEA